MKSEEIRVEMRVAGGNGDDYDEGIVDSIDNDNAVVRWDSGVVTRTPVEDLHAI